MIKFGAKQDNEVSAFGFGMELVAAPWMSEEENKEGLEIMHILQEYEGFLGFTPEFPGMVVIYDTEVHAQTALDATKAAGIKAGNVAEVYVEKRFLPESYKENER